MRRLGFEAVSSTQDMEGLDIASVVPGGPADRGGLAAGDKIHRVDGVPVLEPGDFQVADDADAILLGLSKPRGDSRELMLPVTPLRIGMHPSVIGVMLLLVGIVMLASPLSRPLQLIADSAFSRRIRDDLPPLCTRFLLLGWLGLGALSLLARLGGLESVGWLALLFIALHPSIVDGFVRRRGFRRNLRSIAIAGYQGLPVLLTCLVALIKLGSLEPATLGLAQGVVPLRWLLFRDPVSTCCSSSC